MGAITLNLGLSPARPDLHSRHRHLNLQQLSQQRDCFSVSAHASRKSLQEETDRAGFGETPSRPGRRELLLPLTTGTISGVLRWNVLGLGLGLGLESPSLAEESSSAPDYSITDKVYLEITKCPSISITSRDSGTNSSETQGGTSTLLPSSSTTGKSSLFSYSLTSSSPSSTTTPSPSPPGAPPSSPTPSSSISCSDGELLGRIVIGLYGKQVPETVANFKAMCTGKAGSSYKGSLIHRVLAGQYIMAGKQGFSKEKGEILPPSRLGRNLESVRSEAFKMRHLRPGTVSLCLSENDDEDQIKLDPEYRNVEFLITTGPGPATQLDNKNIVFGTVLEGLDVVVAAAAVPTYKPSERIRQFNELASLLGDERALNARSIWNRPLKALYISDCGEL